MKKYFFETVQDLNGFENARKHFIGNEEKRRNKEIININFPHSLGLYAMFYKGSNAILKNACTAIETLLNAEKTSAKRKNELYKTLIESLNITHHRNTEKRRSKLNGINSLSTCCIDNQFCLSRMACNDSICSHCYSETQQRTQLSLQDRNTINGIILRNVLIESKYWKKYINRIDISKFFRIESFGDVQNVIQAQNYIELCKAFPTIHFAAWTKNNAIWEYAFKLSGKPENLVFNISSNKVNNPELKHFNNKNTDHVFTVYDKEYIKKHNIIINCGGKACMDCIKKKQGCYFKGNGNDKVINEELK